MLKSKSIALILGVLAMSLSTSYLVLAWIEPGSVPPAGNVSSPVNIGSDQQWKAGGLGVGSKTFDLGSGQIAASVFYDKDDSSWYVNPSGVSVFSGNVGIGTAVPLGRLDIATSGTPHVYIRTTANSGDDAILHIKGARTTSTTADIAQIRFEDNTSGDLAYITARKQTASTNQGNLFFWTHNGTSMNEAMRIDKDGEVIIGGGAGKLNVGTVDPIFEIDGKKYATYMADFAGGTRSETSGVVELEDVGRNKPYQSLSAFEINFDNLKKASDLWVFWQTSNKEIKDVAVLLTPGFQGRSWYEKDGNTLTIYGDNLGEVSYRLSAPRVDYQDWSNIVKDQSLIGIKVSDY